MADRKLKIALGATVADPPASVNIYFDEVLIQTNLLISNNPHTPYILEHTFTAGTTHSVRFKMNNDYVNEAEDLNLVISYICLSDESFVYPTDTYLINVDQGHIRVIDDNLLVTAVLWGENGEYTLNFDVENPNVFIDTLPIE